MSIIIVFASKKAGVVGSDGRMHSSALLDCTYQIVKPAQFVRDDFDKTFAVDNEIIGASCGLLSFNQHTIAEHVQEIANDVLQQTDDFREVVTGINKKICDKLESISPDEVLFGCRSVDLLLIGKNPKQNMCIATIRFFPKENRIQSTLTVDDIGRQNKYFLFGDNSAQICASLVLDNNKAQNHDRTFLRKMVIQAVESGIKGAGTQKYGTGVSCGGKIFTKQI